MAQDLKTSSFKIYASCATYVLIIAGGLSPAEVELGIGVMDGRPHIFCNITNKEVIVDIIVNNATSATTAPLAAVTLEDFNCLPNLH